MFDVTQLVTAVKQSVQQEEEHESVTVRKAGLPAVEPGSPADLVLKQNFDSITPAAFVKAFRPVVEAAGVSGQKRVLFGCYLLFMTARKLWEERELEHKKRDGTWTRYFGVPHGTRRDKDGEIKEEGWDSIQYHVLGETEGFDEANTVIKALKRANLVREVFRGAVALAGTEAESRKTRAKAKKHDVPKPSFID